MELLNLDENMQSVSNQQTARTKKKSNKKRLQKEYDKYLKAAKTYELYGDLTRAKLEYENAVKLVPQFKKSKQNEKNLQKLKKKLSKLHEKITNANIRSKTKQFGNSILKMSAGATEDHFSRDSEEIRGKRRQKKLALNEYNVDPDLSVKEDDGDENEDDKGTFMNPNSYDARMAYNIQPDSPRRTVRVFEPNVNHNVGNKSERPNNRRVSWGGQETKIIDDDVDYAIDNYDDALPPPETVDV